MDLAQEVKPTHIFKSGDDELPCARYIRIDLAAVGFGAAAWTIEQPFCATGDRADGSEKTKLAVAATPAVLYPETSFFCLSNERCIESRYYMDLREYLGNGLYPGASPERENDVVLVNYVCQLVDEFINTLAVQGHLFNFYVLSRCL